MFYVDDVRASQNCVTHVVGPFVTADCFEPNNITLLFLQGWISNVSFRFDFPSLCESARLTLRSSNLVGMVYVVAVFGNVDHKTLTLH